MSIEWRHLQTALVAFAQPKVVAKETQKAVRLAGNAVRRHVRAATPRAKRGADLPVGRKPGQTRGEVRMSMRGTGWQSEAHIKAGGLAVILVAGAHAHEITPRKVHALAFGPRGVDGFAMQVMHPGIRGDPYVERAGKESMPEVNVILAATGTAVVTEIATEINGGP